MVSEIGAEVVDLIDPPATDMHGDPVPGTGGEERVEWCGIYPRTTEEAADRSDTVLDKLVGLLPVHEDRIKSTTQLRWRGKVYDIEGSAQPWVFLDGEDACTQVNLKRAAN